MVSKWRMALARQLVVTGYVILTHDDWADTLEAVRRKADEDAALLVDQAVVFLPELFFGVTTRETRH